MLLGYYYVDGREDYGDHFEKARSYTNLYRASLSGVHGRPDPVAFQAGLTRRAVEAGKKIWLALDMPARDDDPPIPWREHLEAQLNETENQVIAVELTDEPMWGPRKARRMAREVRTALGGRLQDVPLGVTLSAQDVLHGGAQQYVGENGYGYIAAEAYLDPRMNWIPAEAHEASRILVRRLWRNCPRSSRFWVVGMSYSRNFEFGPTQALKACQHGTHEGAREKDAEAIVWFSYGRPSGVVSYPRLVREHKAIALAEDVGEGLVPRRVNL